MIFVLEVSQIIRLQEFMQLMKIATGTLLKLKRSYRTPCTPSERQDGAKLRILSELRRKIWKIWMWNFTNS